MEYAQIVTGVCTVALCRFDMIRIVSHQSAQGCIQTMMVRTGKQTQEISEKQGQSKMCSI